MTPTNAKSDAREETDAAPGRRVGYVGLAGAPNVGKSTLVNRLVGQKVSIVSERPQTTRERICGIATDERMQAVLMDVPGITQPRDRLGTALLGWVGYSLRRCDLVWHLRDARQREAPDERQVAEMIRKAGKPAWLVWNKIDRVKGWTAPALTGEVVYARQFGISALRGDGVEALRAALAEALPEGPLLYDPDQTCDRDLRFLAGELVREQLFRHLGQEVPYGTATQTELFDEEREGKTYIRVLIFTEREAHKPIILGRGGTMLKMIGQRAREQIERLVGAPVYLELWVKVRPKWREDERQLLRLGLRPPNSG
jgi:GTP-binding protein Era